MKARLLIIILALLAPALCINARKGKKPDPQRVRRTATTRAAATNIKVCDTIMLPPSDSITVAGYEKTLRSNTESMIISNHTADDITAVGLDIQYLDMKGRMLHRCTQKVSIPDGIPRGESRMVSVPSFDRQGLFYYHLSPKPKRATRATPFKVAVTVSYICIPPKN